MKICLFCWHGRSVPQKSQTAERICARFLCCETWYNRDVKLRLNAFDFNWKYKALRNLCKFKSQLMHKLALNFCGILTRNICLLSEMQTFCPSLPQMKNQAWNEIWEGKKIKEIKYAEWFIENVSFDKTLGGKEEEKIRQIMRKHCYWAVAE